MVVAAMVMMAAVAFPLDEPQHLLRATEEPPDLADVHVRLAFFSTILREQSYEAPREKFRPEPLVFRSVGEWVRIRLQFMWMEYADRRGVRDDERLLNEGPAGD
jgi:hypothetical protein